MASIQPSATKCLHNNFLRPVTIMHWAGHVDMNGYCTGEILLVQRCVLSNIPYSNVLGKFPRWKEIQMKHECTGNSTTELDNTGNFNIPSIVNSICQMTSFCFIWLYSVRDDRITVALMSRSSLNPCRSANAHFLDDGWIVSTKSHPSITLLWFLEMILKISMTK